MFQGKKVETSSTFMMLNCKASKGSVTCKVSQGKSSYICDLIAYASYAHICIMIKRISLYLERESGRGVVP